MGVKLSWRVSTDGSGVWEGYLGDIPFGRIEPVEGGAFRAHLLVREDREAIRPRLAEAADWTEEEFYRWLSSADLKVRRVRPDGSGTLVQHR